MRDEVCKTCKGRGVTSGRHWLGLAVMRLLEAGALSFSQDKHLSLWARTVLLRNEGEYPSTDLGQLTTALAGRPPDNHVGHDELDKYNTIDKIIQAAGLDPKSWGICPECKGE